MHEVYLILKQQVSSFFFT